MTELLYQTDSYLQECEAQIVAHDEENHGVILDRTVFYPGGGGQPADKGVLICDGMTYTVTRAKKSGNDVLHILEGVLSGRI